ncbi:hypothetical protein Tco_0474536, partial [Tanacetum coccineum]
VLDLENTKTAQAQEIISLKLRVKKLEKKGGSRIHKLKRLYKVGRSARMVSSDEASLGDQEDASKHERNIDDIDKDAEITLVDETHGRYGDDLMFDIDSNGIRSARPKSKGIVFREPDKSTTTTTRPQQQPIKDKGKGIMEEPKKPTKRKDQIRHDEEVAQRLQAQMQAELEEEDRLVRQREKEANIVSWDNIQEMINDDYQMVQQMQAEEQEKLSIEEKSKLFVQLLEARKKHFAAMRAKEKRNKPPTKAQKRNTMSTYLKNMVGYKHNQLNNKRFDDIQKLFDKAMKRKNTFVDIDTELVEGNEVRVEGNEEEITIDVVPLAVKSPSILVKARYRSTRPVGEDRVLWGDLMTMFEPNVADDIWRNQQEYRLLSWKLYDSCGVHCLMTNSMHIYMLVEKKYPLAPITLSKIWEKKLQVDYLCEMAYQLLRFIKPQLKK